MIQLAPTFSRASIFFTLYLTANSAVAWGRGPDTNWKARPITIQAQNLTLRGYRYLPSNGRPNRGAKVLLTHALNENLHEFESIIPALVRAGYDCYAFNFRGHGNGSERSVVTEYHDGDYGFERMVDVDFPAMIRFVQADGREPIMVIGHSMGGMVPRAALIAKTVSERAIRGLVLLGSPPHFASKNIPLENFGLGRVVEWRVFAGSGAEPFNALSFLSASDGIPKTWLKTFSRPILRGLVRLENFGASDSSWPSVAITHDPPKDIYRSFFNFRHKGYPYRDRAIDVPTLVILGKDDWLVPYKDAVESAAVQFGNSGYSVLLIEDASHLDLIAGATVHVYQQLLLDFLERPNDIVQRHGHDVHRLKVHSAKPDWTTCWGLLEAS